MNTLRNPELRTLSDRQLQARLERQVAARKAAQSVIDARIATKRQQFRADAKAPMRVVPSVAKPAPVRETFGWVDSYIFLTPLAIVAALILLARWSGMLS